MPQAGQSRSRLVCQVLRVVTRATIVAVVVVWIRSMVGHDCAQLSISRNFISCEYSRGRMEFGGGCWTDRAKKSADTFQFYSVGAFAFPISAGGPHGGTFGAEILRGPSRAQLGLGAGTFGVEMFRHHPSPAIGPRVVMPCWLPVWCGVLTLGAIRAGMGRRIQRGFPVGAPGSRTGRKPSR
jgi:hypothetical protein